MYYLFQNLTSAPLALLLSLHEILIHSLIGPATGAFGIQATDVALSVDIHPSSLPSRGLFLFSLQVTASILRHAPTL